MAANRLPGQTSWLLSNASVAQMLEQPTKLACGNNLRKLAAAGNAGTDGTKTRASCVPRPEAFWSPGSRRLVPDSQESVKAISASLLRRRLDSLWWIQIILSHPGLQVRNLGRSQSDSSCQSVPVGMQTRLSFTLAPLLSQLGGVLLNLEFGSTLSLRFRSLFVDCHGQSFSIEILNVALRDDAKRNVVQNRSLTQRRQQRGTKNCRNERRQRGQSGVFGTATKRAWPAWPVQS